MILSSCCIESDCDTPHFYLNYRFPFKLQNTYKIKLEFLTSDGDTCSCLQKIQPMNIEDRKELMNFLFAAFNVWMATKEGKTLKEAITEGELHE